MTKMTLSEFTKKWGAELNHPTKREEICNLLAQYGYYADIVDEILEDLQAAARNDVWQVAA